jgi:hypothetical protein
MSLEKKLLLGEGGSCEFLYFSIPLKIGKERKTLKIQRYDRTIELWHEMFTR